MTFLSFISGIFFFFQAEDGIRDKLVTGVQTCALPICRDPRPFQLVVFVIAAVFAGLAGALFAPFRGFASPEVMFWVFSGQGLMMVIMGGIGTLVGPVLGAMLFILIQEVLSSYTEHWMIFTGVVFVLIVIFLPGGLVGTARRLGARG